MKRFAVIDISAFIWNVNHFRENKPDYYTLMEVLPNLYEGIIKYKIPVIMRQQLIDEIYTYFPYDLIPNEYYAFQLSTLTFFSQILPRLEGYPEYDNSAISSIPSLTKEHYKPSTNTEVRYLITHLHTNHLQLKNFLTFNIVWNYKKNLKTKSTIKREIETIICDDVQLHETILQKFKNLFVHNPKHNVYNSSDYNSPLSCYNERLGDTDKAQRLLDESIEYKGSYYCFDSENDVYVKFVCTINNIYHGYNVILSGVDLVNIRKTFNK
jgi:hypothetical protein